MEPKDRIKNRRDIGRVEFLADKMAAARELSSCCAGVEAALERGRVTADVKDSDIRPWPLRIWSQRPG